MSIKSLLFNINIESDKPYHASLLVAEPFLKEDYFRRAVICLVDYDGESSGSMGVVMNRPTAYKLQELLETIKVERPVTVYCGGPVSTDRLFFIHTLGDIIPGGMKIRDGLWLGGDFTAMEDYVNSGYPIEGKIKFFIGYSGWSRGQLEEEIKAHTWAVAPIISNQQLMMESEDTMWHTVVRQLGEEYRGWRYHPIDPHVN